MSTRPHPDVTGLHHVTCIAGDPQRNLDFYTGTLGMRLVKRSVNQDAPDTYHLFYADAEGHAGSDLTFFPWPEMPPGRRGVGLTNEVALAVPPGTLGWWADRLRTAGVRLGDRADWFGEPVLPFEDPDGLALALVETGDPREFTPWTDSPVDASRQVRGLHTVRLAERDLAPTERFLTQGLGFTAAGEERGWHRYSVRGGGSGRSLDIQVLPDGARGAWGVGSVHHIAWRVPDGTAQRDIQGSVARAGGRPTDVIDRFWFQSVYFREPGGALFEVATDGPGFGVDEPTESLGERLILPPWLEPRRAQIERALPKLGAPVRA
ncbi:MAG TPA: ring-cleaving dioxygenase [Gemmatimonadales bacterium]|nr:ring-cleaving dioxygenase [Gemmatimonadales bacterium]